jgi:hypothetical protein
MLDVLGATGTAAEKATKKGNKAMSADCFILIDYELEMLRTKELG